MRLTARAVLPYLVEKGVLAPSEIMQDDWTVIPRFGRNTNYEVRNERESGYFVKQADRRISGSTRTLRREAEIGWLAMHDPAFRPVRDVAPAAIRYDPARSVLVSRLVPRAAPLSLMGVEAARKNAAELGRELSRIHRTLVAQRLHALRNSPARLPWLIRAVSEPTGKAFVGPGIATAFLRLLKRDPILHRGLRGLATRHRQACLIHGDLKRDNILVGADRRVQLVDWELADVGDPAWDLGALLLMLLRAPVACEELLRGYGDRSPELLDRSVRCLGVRALQRAYEYYAGPASRRSLTGVWLQHARTLFLERGPLVERLGAWA